MHLPPVGTFLGTSGMHNNDRCPESPWLSVAPEKLRQVIISLGLWIGPPLRPQPAHCRGGAGLGLYTVRNDCDRLVLPTHRRSHQLNTVACSHR